MTLSINVSQNLPKNALEHKSLRQVSEEFRTSALLRDLVKMDKKGNRIFFCQMLTFLKYGVKNC